MATSLTHRTLSRRQGLGAGLGLAMSSVPFALLAAQGTPISGTSGADLLRRTEERRLQSLVDFDREVADSLHADDFQLVNPAGGILSKEEYLGGLEEGFLDYVRFEPVSPIAVHLFPESAALRYQSDIEIAFSDGTADKGTFWHTDLYEKRSDEWRAVWSQATRII
ncbi:MAG: hypothetical protein AVDCRST_MAG93-2341 [uncultured Chloroflexia bacterium]|uniref:DUF4440 domain-containing protein n=1 Tax=uncultured Chloroflexia bacterium TaxID=1672391 RepID=A0A6J4J0P1_9CHLR|nr:MAG: hypothetical protein AVDCRST_MAG93-2341 [uncultured Chloroflexia bacterium]